MLFVGSLIPRMSMEQVAHLPELLTHYQQHQREEGNDLSFWAFLLDHYLPDSPHHKAPCHSHNRLPSFDGGSSAYDFMQAFRFVYEPFVTELASAAIFKVPLFNARQAFSSLLQPPRFWR
ncbi:hypothetical protein HNV11_20860 [Spirosoma taeanense]|uniref:Uncharacterized protein n=1 Tax=Spirosoma taeanense TaxID=2735870 RepID=A0A6M5YC80_9BACT|nr:hypothetical protein [Spirosoma taeanense]QJW91655.1 hypothetical protein HNV11_20860 [Spirosoma taeanense]